MIEMDSSLIFEQNLDVVLKFLDREVGGASLNELAFIGVVGNLAILVSQLKSEHYIAISELEQRISITPKGKSFLYKKGGYVQSKINSTLEGTKARKPLWTIFKTLVDSLSLLFLIVAFFSATAMLCTCLFIVECYRFIINASC